MSEVSVTNGMLEFTDEMELKTIIDSLNAMNIRDSIYFPIDSIQQDTLDDIPIYRWFEDQLNFYGLRQSINEDIEAELAQGTHINDISDDYFIQSELMRMLLNEDNEMKVGDDIHKYIDPCTAFIIHNENWTLLSEIRSGIDASDLANPDLEVFKMGTDCIDCDVYFYSQRLEEEGLEYEFTIYSPFGDYPDIDYYWDFGDGFSSTDDNPIHEYAGEGEYNVTLVAIEEGECYSKISFKLLATDSDCKVEFSEKVDDKTVQFTDKSQPSDGGWINTWYWEFGDGTYSTLQNPSHTYAVADNYNVKLTITDNLLCTKTTKGDGKKVKIKEEEDCCKMNGKAPKYDKDYTDGAEEWYMTVKGWKTNFILFTTMGAKSTNFHRVGNEFKKDKADFINAYIAGRIFYEDCETEVVINRSDPKSNKKSTTIERTFWIDASRIKRESLTSAHFIEDEDYELPALYIRTISPNCD